MFQPDMALADVLNLYNNCGYTFEDAVEYVKKYMTEFEIVEFSKELDKYLKEAKM